MMNSPLANPPSVLRFTETTLPANTWRPPTRYRKLAGQLRTFIDFPNDLHAHILESARKGDLEEATAFLARDLDRTSRLVIGVYSPK